MWKTQSLFLRTDQQYKRPAMRICEQLATAEAEAEAEAVEAEAYWMTTCQDGVNGIPALGGWIEQNDLLFTYSLLIAGIIQFSFHLLILVRLGVLV